MAALSPTSQDPHTLPFMEGRAHEINPEQLQPSLLFRKDELGYTPFHWLAYHGQTDLLPFLPQAPALYAIESEDCRTVTYMALSGDIANGAEQSQCTPLYDALPDCAKSIDILTVSDEYGESALRLLAEFGLLTKDRLPDPSPGHPAWRECAHFLNYSDGDFVRAARQMKELGVADGNTLREFASRDRLNDRNPLPGAGLEP